MKSRTPSFVIELDLKTGEDQAKNAAKYPVKDCWGSSAKYDALKKHASSSMLFSERQRNACAP